MAPPRLELPADAAHTITTAAADGFSMRGIASLLKVSLDTLQRRFDEDEALREAFEIGREKERQTLHNVLYRLATESNDKVAAMFLLKARHGYREGDQSETANRVSINFSLPGAMPLEQFVTVNDEPADRTQRLPDAPVKRR